MEEAPWVFVKTQYGPIEAHIVLVEMLDALSKEFLELEVQNEGGHWSTRDTALLRRKREFLEGAMKAFETALREDRTPLSWEARETPAIVADVVGKSRSACIA